MFSKESQKREIRTTTQKPPETSSDFTRLLHDTQKRENPPSPRIEYDSHMDEVPRTSYPERDIQDTTHTPKQDTERSDSLLVRMKRRMIMNRLQTAEAVSGETATTHYDSSAEVISEATRSAYEQRGLTFPKFVKNTVGRRAVNAFIHRFEKIEQVNNSLSCVNDIQHEYNQQSQHGDIPPAQLHIWEKRVQQAQERLQREQGKGFKDLGDFCTYNTNRLHQSLHRIRENGLISKQDYQTLESRTKNLINTTRQHSAVDFTTSLQHINETQSGITRTWKGLYDRKTLESVLTPEIYRLVQHHFGITSSEFSEMMISGRYLPVKSQSAKAFHFSWKNADGTRTVRQIQTGPERLLHTEESSLAGEQLDRDILERCNAQDKVVRLLPPDRRYQCHGYTLTNGDDALGRTDLKDVLTSRFQELRSIQDAESGDIIVYVNPSIQLDKSIVHDNQIEHSGVVVANRNGDVIIISKFNQKGGLYMHRPQDIQATCGNPIAYTTDHPAGRFLVPDTTIDWRNKA